MLTLATARAIDYVVIGLTGTTALTCLAAAAYTVPWRASARLSKGTREFNVLWRTRLLFELTGAAWMLCQLLRLNALWGMGSAIVPGRVTAETQGGVLCRLYLAITLGLLQPFYLALALLLCHMTLSRRRPEAGMYINAWIAALAFAACVVPAVLQTLAAWASAFSSTWHWERKPDSIPRRFFATYIADGGEDGGGSQCSGPDGTSRCALCVYPAASSCIAVGLAALYAGLLWRATSRMALAVINRRLRKQLRLFQVTMFAGLTAEEALRSVTIVATPLSWAFQMTWLGYEIIICVMVAACSWLLVVRPVWDAHDADTRLEWGDAFGGSSEEPQELVLLVKARSGRVEPTSPGPAGQQGSPAATAFAAEP